REESDVRVSAADDDEARPGPARVPRVQGIGPAPQAEPERLAVEGIEVPTDEIPQGVAARRVPRQEDHVREHEDRAEPDAEVAVEVEREKYVPPQEDEERRREDERVPVRVWDEEREARLAGVARVRVGGRPVRRRPDE